MQKSILSMLVLTICLGACAGIQDSRLNPFNWFGNSESRRSSVTNDELIKYQRHRQDWRPLVDQVIALSVEAIPEGAILRATGLPSAQGHWAAELVEVESDNIEPGVLVFDFRLAPPTQRTNAGAQHTREVTVATYLSFVKLDGVRRIVVRGRGTERSVRR